MELADAIQIVSRLSRTKRFPTTRDELEGLAEGLQCAHKATGVPGPQIVTKCAELSEWCPTDADLLTVARDIARCAQVAQGSFDSMAHAKPPAGAEGCALCHGSGFQIIYTLLSYEGGSKYSYRKRENVSESQARELQERIDPTKQEIFSGARRCPCRTEKAGAA